MDNHTLMQRLAAIHNNIYGISVREDDTLRMARAISDLRALLSELGTEDNDHGK